MSRATGSSRVRPARVSSTCLVTVARNRYSVPCEYAGKWVSSRLYPTRIEVVADDALIASHVRLLDRDQVSYDWQHYLPLIERKPGALRNGAPFADLPAPLRQLKHGLGRHAGGDRIMAQVLAAVPVAGLDAVLVAVELVVVVERHGREPGLILGGQHRRRVAAEVRARHRDDVNVGAVHDVAQ